MNNFAHFRPTDADTFPPQDDPLRVVGLPAAEIAVVPIREMKGYGEVMRDAWAPHAAQHAPWSTLEKTAREQYDKCALAVIREYQNREHEVIWDLLNALKGVLRVADRNTVEFDAARTAIAQAEGSQTAPKLLTT